MSRWCPHCHRELDDDVDWDRMERLVWQDLKVKTLAIDTHYAEHSTLYRVVLTDSNGRIHEGNDWRLEAAIEAATEELRKHQ